MAEIKYVVEAASWEAKIATGILGPLANAMFSELKKEYGYGDSYKLEQISSHVRELQHDVSALRQSVSKLSGQLLDTLVTLKQDHLQDLVSQIDSDYFQIADVVRLLADHTSAKNQALVEQCQESLLDLLKQATKDLPGRLRTMHNALVQTDENGLPELAAKRLNQVEVSGDMITYWLKMRAFFLPFWLAQAQAIGILATASQHPNLHYVQGPDVVKRCKDGVEEQQRFFTEITGPAVCDIAERILIDRRDCHVKIYSHDDRHLCVSSIETPSVIVTKNRPYKLTWMLHADFDTSPDKLDLDGWHCFEIQLNDWGFKGTLHSSWESMAFLQQPGSKRPPGQIEHIDRTFRLLWNRPDQSFRLQAMFLPGAPHLFIDDKMDINHPFFGKGNIEWLEEGTYRVWSQKREKNRRGIGLGYDEQGWRWWINCVS